MPQQIEHIDAIARKKGRDVLFVRFHDNPRQKLDWAALPVRQQITSWLDGQGIEWQPCGDVGSTTFFGPYLGQIYIEAPFDLSDPQYIALSDFLEKPDGTMALPGALFCCCLLTAAMKNAHHDTPGFWEKLWAEF